MRHGESHLRDADGAGRVERRISGACGVGRDQLANRMELEDWAAADARRWGSNLVDRNDYLRAAAIFGDGRFQGDAEVSEIKLSRLGLVWQGSGIEGRTYFGGNDGENPLPQRTQR